MNRLGIEFLSVLGMPPVETVTMAADLGCAHISCALTSFPMNPHGYPAWSLRDDAALRRDMIAAMRDRGVFISRGEGLLIRPNVDVRDREIELDLMVELGVQRINNVSMDPDLGRTFDQVAIQVEMAEARGMESTVEFAPGTTIADLPSALALIRHVGKPSFRLLVDTMHLIRSGSTPADLAALDPDLIGYAQLCDVPLTPVIPDYMKEATFERMAPGSGELPLLDILKALSRHVLLGLEVPRYKDAEAGIGPYERLGPCVGGARTLLLRLEVEGEAAKD